MVGKAEEISILKTPLVIENGKDKPHHTLGARYYSVIILFSGTEKIQGDQN
jgi:hypothetical protein